MSTQRKLACGEIPTIADLEAAGAYAGSLIDATWAELTHANYAPDDEEGRKHVAEKLQQLEQRRLEYFGRSA